jgi:hypothetical protein
LIAVNCIIYCFFGHFDKFNSLYFTVFRPLTFLNKMNSFITIFFYLLFYDEKYRMLHRCLTVRLRIIIRTGT